MTAESCFAALAAVILAAGAGTARAQSSQARPLDTALPVIVRADSEWLGAMRAHDADRVVAPYDRDGMFVTADGVTIHGRDSIAARYRRRLAAVVRVVDGGITRDGTQAVNDTLVYEWGHGGMTFTDSTGATHAAYGPYLTVWRRDHDGAWRIIRNLVF